MFLVGVRSSKVAFTAQLVPYVAAHEIKFCELAHDVRSACSCCACDETLVGVLVAGERQGSLSSCGLVRVWGAKATRLCEANIGLRLCV